MKPKDQPDASPTTPTAPLNTILSKHGASLSLKGSRGSSHKSIAEDLIAELENEKFRANVVQNNLNAILNQYQVTAASLKALQASHEDLSRKYNQKLLDLKGTNGDDETDPKGE